jgi:lysophospholipase L1-like esterase
MTDIKSATSRTQRARNLRAGLIISLTTTLLMLCMGEFYFRYIFLKSDSSGFTLMHQRWESICWKPTFRLTSDKYPNGEMVYRDRSWTEADVQGKTKIMVVGDSFTAAWGVCDVQKRFSNLLQTQLGDGYAVFNVAVPGWETSHHIMYPKLYPHKPDIVILSYMANDIYGAIQKSGEDRTRSPVTIPWWYNTPLRESYLLDFVYWQVIYKQFLYRRQVAEAGINLWKTQLDSYFIPAIWDEQKREIITFIDWTREINAPLIVITWPRLDDRQNSVQQMSMVEAIFKERGIPIISTLDLFRDEPAEKLIVSNIDPHPSEYSHNKVAEALYKAIQNLPPPR